MTIRPARTRTKVRAQCAQPRTARAPLRVCVSGAGRPEPLSRPAYAFSLSKLYRVWLRNRAHLVDFVDDFRRGGPVREDAGYGAYAVDGGGRELERAVSAGEEQAGVGAADGLCVV